MFSTRKPITAVPAQISLHFSEPSIPDSVLVQCSLLHWGHLTTFPASITFHLQTWNFRKVEFIPQKKGENAGKTSPPPCGYNQHASPCTLKYRKKVECAEISPFFLNSNPTLDTINEPSTHRDGDKPISNTRLAHAL
jgi:hypothetical protein